MRNRYVQLHKLTHIVHLIQWTSPYKITDFYQLRWLSTEAIKKTVCKTNISKMNTKTHYFLNQNDLLHRLNYGFVLSKIVIKINLFFTGIGVLGTWYIWSGCQVLETWHQRHCRHKNIKKSSILCTTGSNWSIDIVSIEPGKCGRIQFRTCIRMLSA